MKKIQIFEPAMCCSTGLCGVCVDPELLRLSTVLNTLSQKGIVIKRFNLSSAPAEFITNQVINEFIMKNGAEKLPAILVDDKVEICGRYPTNAEFERWLDLPAGTLGLSAKANSCCDGGCF